LRRSREVGVVLAKERAFYVIFAALEERVIVEDPGLERYVVAYVAAAVYLGAAYGRGILPVQMAIV
jgi:hypothetical protein